MANTTSFWGEAWGTITGLGDSLLSFGNYASNQIGSIITPNLWEEGTQKFVESVVGDAAVGAIIGGATAALTGEDVLKGAGIGGAVGGAHGYFLGSEGDVLDSTGKLAGERFGLSDIFKSKQATPTNKLTKLNSKNEKKLTDQFVRKDSSGGGSSWLTGDAVLGAGSGLLGYMNAKDEADAAKKKIKAEQAMQDDRLIADATMNQTNIDANTDITNLKAQIAANAAADQYDRTKLKYQPGIVDPMMQRNWNITPTPIRTVHVPQEAQEMQAAQAAQGLLQPQVTPMSTQLAQRTMTQQQLRQMARG